MAPQRLHPRRRSGFLQENINCQRLFSWGWKFVSISLMHDWISVGFVLWVQSDLLWVHVFNDPENTASPLMSTTSSSYRLSDDMVHSLEPYSKLLLWWTWPCFPGLLIWFCCCCCLEDCERLGILKWKRQWVLEICQAVQWELRKKSVLQKSTGQEGMAPKVLYGNRDYWRHLYGVFELKNLWFLINCGWRISCG